VSSTKQVKVPLMYQEGEFKFLKKKGFQLAALPYKGLKLSMIVLLPDAAGGPASLEMQLKQLTEPKEATPTPDAANGLAMLEKQLTTANLALWLGELDRTGKRTIWLYLPRFKLETDYDLVAPCKKLGMKDAFGRKADFSGMGWPEGKLWISQIKHKAFVEVNEEGTEAAAATAVEVTTESAEIYPMFRADHPFIYLIRDNKTGSILFMGRMANPVDR
ncbi:MAG: serpin family protein, partial [Phycisphaerae bacterium]|nr:serpin family protein [Phycisphaerae bacterium]